MVFFLPLVVAAAETSSTSATTTLRACVSPKAAKALSHIFSLVHLYIIYSEQQLHGGIKTLNTHEHCQQNYMHGQKLRVKRHDHSRLFITHQWLPKVLYFWCLLSFRINTKLHLGLWGVKSQLPRVTRPVPLYAMAVWRNYFNGKNLIWGRLLPIVHARGNIYMMVLKNHLHLFFRKLRCHQIRRFYAFFPKGVLDLCLGFFRKIGGKFKHVDFSQWHIILWTEMEECMLCFGRGKKERRKWEKTLATPPN